MTVTPAGWPGEVAWLRVDICMRRESFMNTRGQLFRAAVRETAVAGTTAEQGARGTRRFGGGAHSARSKTISGLLTPAADERAEHEAERRQHRRRDEVADHHVGRRRTLSPWRRYPVGDRLRQRPTDRATPGRSSVSPGFAAQRQAKPGTSTPDGPASPPAERPKSFPTRPRGRNRKPGWRPTGS